MREERVSVGHAGGVRPGPAVGGVRQPAAKDCKLFSEMHFTLCFNNLKRFGIYLKC